MDPIRFAIDNPVKVSVGVLLVVMFGLLALARIPVQLTPNVERPVVSVTTTWEGASPQEIENDVIREQEDKLKTIPGLEKMTSYCRQDQGQVLLEFPVGSDKDAAMREVSEKLRQVPDYPENVDEPVVEASDPNNRDYIAWIILNCTDKSYDVRHLQKWAEDNIKVRLERVRGVSEVNVLGGSEPEVQVQVQPRLLAQRHIAPGQLAQALRDRNLNRSAGDIDEGKLAVRLRVVGQYRNLEEINQTILSAPGEPVVRVRDVGRAVLTYKEPTAVVRSRGKRVLAINAQREVGSNVMQVMNRYRLAIHDLNEHILPEKARALGLNGTLSLQQVYDQTIYIDQAIHLVTQNLYIGGVLAVLILLLFLRSWKFTGVVALAIPISVIGTFVAMVAMGRNINVISLAGLAFAVGMVVDNAIVVLENIDRHRRLLHEEAFHSAYTGAREVWGAILASTLTTLAVFLPVIFIEEEAGQLFRDISLAICAAVSFSLVVSVMVIPTVASRFMRREQRQHTAEKRQVGWRRWFDSLFGLTAVAGWLTDRIAGTVHWLIRGWVLRLALIALLTVVSVIGSYWLMPPSTYLPTGNRNLAFGLLIPPPGYNIDFQEQIGLRFESHVRPYWVPEDQNQAPSADSLPPVPLVDPATGEVQMVPGAPINHFFFVGLKNGQMFCGAVSADDDRVEPVVGLLNATIRKQPGIFGFAAKAPLIRSEGGFGSGVELEIRGDDLGKVNAAAEAVFGGIRQRWGPQSVRADPGNFNLPAQEVQVRIDMVRAADLDLSNSELGLTTAMLGDGAIFDEYIYEGDGIDLKIIAADQPDNAEYVRDIPLATPAGSEPVTLGSVADIRRTTAPQQINRIEQQRSVTLEINLPEALPLDTAMATLSDEIIQPLRREGGIDPTVETNLAGTAAKLTQVKRALLGAWSGFNLDSLFSLMTSRAFLALLVVFLLMAALFESWFYPLVIMFTVPLATVGGFLGLRITHEFVPEQQLDVLTMLGFVILIGIVVNNAILIVHQALNFMRGEAEATEPGGEGGQAKKLEPRQAIVESVRSRVRPIFMSTLTSVGGMLPLVLAPGAGSELYRGLGSVVVGGLLLSTVFTLMLTPLVMSVVLDLRTLLARAVAGQVDSH